MWNALWFWRSDAVRNSMCTVSYLVLKKQQGRKGQTIMDYFTHASTCLGMKHRIGETLLTGYFHHQTIQRCCSFASTSLAAPPTGYLLFTLSVLRHGFDLKHWLPVCLHYPAWPAVFLQLHVFCFISRHPQSLVFLFSSRDTACLGWEPSSKCTAETYQPFCNYATQTSHIMMFMGRKG